jgi:mannose-1-phosphate guanylyltransferase
VKAIILAAGRGTRLRPLTDTCPKPMLPISGQPLLEHIVVLLASHGYDELIINLHHLPDQIRVHMGDGSRWSVHITYSYEAELLGTAGAVRQVAAELDDESFLVYYGDNLTNFNLTDMGRAHAGSGAAATIGLLWMDEPCTRGIIGLDATGRVDRLVEKPRPDQGFADYLVNAGTYLLEPQVLDHIPVTGASDFARDVFPAMLRRGAALYGHRMLGDLLSTDTPERYALARKRVASGAFTLPGRANA